MLRCAWMSAITREPKTFNNGLISNGVFSSVNRGGLRVCQKGGFFEHGEEHSHLPYCSLLEKCGPSLAIGGNDLHAMSKMLRETVQRTRR